MTKFLLMYYFGFIYLFVCRTLAVGMTVTAYGTLVSDWTASAPDSRRRSDEHP